jgi:hypothetical protein
MPWQSLSATLNSKPRVLAGPVLRKVTPKEVTVWLALRKPGNVTLKVLEATGNTQPMGGKHHTIPVGANLHIVAVTAKVLPPFADLTEGRIYRYDLEFDFDDGVVGQTLAAATHNARLAYLPFDKPSFCLPPADLNKLRLIHGSCRIPHGNGADAMPMLDGLIEQAADNPDARPHQLLLTGDQIYADDVGFAMSMMLGDAAETLLGWSEDVPISLPAHPPRMKVTDLSPAVRENALPLNAGFTSVDVVCHLIGLGEYLAMYLFVWSDVLWPSVPATVPTYDEIVSYFQQRESGIYAELGYRQMHRQERDGINSQTARTTDFGRTIKDVRCALANIPNYMIFDDHEITDDWNMTSNICKAVYGSELGLRVVQNGLAAYALCQHWGNVPEQFCSSTTVSVGEKLMLLLDGANTATYNERSPAIRSLLGMHDASTLATRQDKGLFHDPVSFIYNYTVEGPGHQIIVTDTRTWRSYPRGPSEGGDFLPGAQLQSQILNTPPLGDRALLVVLTTNAPPSQPIRTASRHPNLTRRLAKIDDGDASPDMYEAWEMPRNATDRLFKAISDKQPLVAGRRHGRAVLLSGDVHTSFTSRLLLTGTMRFEDPQGSPQPVRMVIAQLVASSFRKQTGKTEGMHREGYDYAPTGAGWIVPSNKPEGYIGWNLPAGVKKRVAKYKNNPGSGNSYTPIEAKGPKTLSMWDATHGVVAEIPPDYSYRLDYLYAVLQAPLPPSPPPIPPVPPTGNSAEDRKRAAEAFHKATGSYRKFNAANATRQEMVGVNNIGEITFDWGAGDAKFALHTLRWRDWQRASDVFTTYVCSLDPDPNHATFPELKPLSP